MEFRITTALKIVTINLLCRQFMWVVNMNSMYYQHNKLKYIITLKQKYQIMNQNPRTF